MSGTRFMAAALMTLWGMVAIGWAAALRVSRRSGVPWIAVLADRKSWERERTWGMHTGRLMLAWLVAGTILMFLVGFWRP